MSTNSYVPPHLRNKQITTEQSINVERKNPFQKERRVSRRPHEKPFWMIEKEREQLELEEKKKAAERGLEDTLDNFPMLGGIPNTTNSGTSNIWSGSRKFSELASEWKSSDEQRKEDEERDKNHANDNNHDDVFQLPRFRNIHRFGEPEDEYCDDTEDQPPSQVKPEDEWKVVDNRRYRKPKPAFDFSDESLDDYHEHVEDGTVWGAPEEHETCWDERRH